jgi:hypothetical protein
MHSAPTYRFVLAWIVMVVGPAVLWPWRPWLGAGTFFVGQIAAFLVSWKVASLLCLAPEAWGRFTPLRLLAYCIFYGMQPRQFLVGAKTPPGAPVPTIRSFLLNLATGLALVLLAPRLLPAATPLAVRFWVALVGAGFLFLMARLDFYALLFRLMGFAVEKVWDCPVAATSLDEFWGRRWNRIVSGFLREVLFFPVARRAGARTALLAVFLYSGFYHEVLCFLAQSGYGGPTAYFFVQFLGVAAEGSRVGRRLLRNRPWLGRGWTLAVVILPLGLLLPQRLLDDYLLPLLVMAGVPGLEV